jgi:hypothetical protein
MIRKVTTIGLEMPADFPLDPYEAVHKRVCHWEEQMRRSSATDQPSSVWSEYAGGWNAVAHRFLSCAMNSDRFVASIRRFGPSPDSEERHVQEDALFCFLVNGLSCLESLGHGLHAIASMLRNRDFPMVTESDLREVSVSKTTERFQRVFPAEPITSALVKLATAREYKNWKRVRNVLAHRAHPARVFTTGGPVKWQLHDIAIDEKTTTVHRGWLAANLLSLLEAASEFTARYF